mmetsp:Transcript_28053/g.47045  ORF Transcript_28053/g.47045 Transcript_28053/m.47045 type:complete len:205 (-) Transcript_28053:108-722(-)
MTLPTTNSLVRSSSSSTSSLMTTRNSPTVPQPLEADTPSLTALAATLTALSPGTLPLEASSTSSALMSRKEKKETLSSPSCILAVFAWSFLPRPPDSVKMPASSQHPSLSPLTSPPSPPSRVSPRLASPSATDLPRPQTARPSRPSRLLISRLEERTKTLHSTLALPRRPAPLPWPRSTLQESVQAPQPLPSTLLALLSSGLAL